MYNCIAVSVLFILKILQEPFTDVRFAHYVNKKEMRKKKVIELIASKDKIIKESINIFYTKMYIDVF